MIKSENQQVYLCKTDDRKKIFFNETTKDFGSVYYLEKKAGKGLLLTTNILSYVFIRQFDFLILDSKYQILVICVTIFLGGVIGAIAGIVRRKRLYENEITVKKIKMDPKKLDEFLLLTKIELNQNEDTVFLLIAGSIFSFVVFYFFKTLFLLFGGMILISMGVFYLFEYEFKRRKNIYSELTKMNFK